MKKEEWKNTNTRGKMEKMSLKRITLIHHQNNPDLFPDQSSHIRRLRYTTVKPERP